MRGHSQTVGRYQLRDELGAGGFATVYCAYDPVLDREVALKLLHPHLARDGAIRDRFVREGRALARVDHPSVVQVFDAGEAEGTAYLSMKLIRGRALDDILAERGPLPLAEVVEISEQVAAALAAVHARNLVHRDIKPANVLIDDESRRAVLLDLGIARALDAVTMLSGNFIVGTPGYMAPEQLETGGQVSPQTDVYQLGATVYTLLAGRPPFEGDTMQVLHAVVSSPPPDLSEFRPDLPPGVVGVVAEAMAKNPAFRPRGTREFAADLRAAAGLGPPPDRLQTAARQTGGDTVPRELCAGDATVPLSPARGRSVETESRPPGYAAPAARRKVWPFAAAGAAAVVLALGAVVLATNRPGGTSPTPSATAAPTAVQGRQPIVATVPPDRGRTAEERAIIEALNAANRAQLVAYRNIDTTGLEQFFTGQALDQTSGEINADLKRLGRYAVGDLNRIELLELNMQSPARATIRTREALEWDEFLRGSDERVAGKGYSAVQIWVYQMVKRDNRWFVEQSEVAERESYTTR